ncbi:MAG: hypothetical protein IT306_03285 [Chloroflexi bacterium]|nr:hypothetical protein [Chloroflexota bacterium]
MAFSVEDFHDLIALLDHHPEWRAELCRHVLSDEIRELPALVRQLVEAQVRTETRLEELVQAHAHTDTRLERLESWLGRVEAALLELAEAQGRTETRLGDVEVLELRYARRGPASFGPIARRLRVMETGPFADMLDDAVEAGRLTSQERDAVLLADIVLTGRRRDNEQAVEMAGDRNVWYVIGGRVTPPLPRSPS